MFDNQVGSIEGMIMKKVFINKVKTMLEIERKAIISRAKQHANTEIDTDGDDTDEIQGRIIALATAQLIARDKEKLAKIENAFKRIADGSFGKCVECEEDIGEKRLLANPGSVNCISCAEVSELEAKRNGR
jgi:DnaK suppressor protein